MFTFYKRADLSWNSDVLFSFSGCLVGLVNHVLKSHNIFYLISYSSLVSLIGFFFYIFPRKPRLKKLVRRSCLPRRGGKRFDRNNIENSKHVLFRAERTDDYLKTWLLANNIYESILIIFVYLDLENLLNFTSCEKSW